MSDAQIAGVPIIILLVASIVLAGFWILFPIIIWGQLKEIIKLLKEVRDRGDEIEGNTRPPGREKPKESAASYRMPRQ
jgi:predicted PurR-regulated permease PerM